MNHKGAVEKDNLDPPVGLGSLGEEVETGGIDALYLRFGSLRRVFHAYWKGDLTATEERLLEDAISPDERYRYKPCQ